MEPVIVIVDDDSATLELLTAFFRRGNYEIRTASTGLQALSMLDHRVKLVITDEEMPELRGSDLRDMIRSKYNIPVIGMTGLRYVDKDDFKDHFDSALFKPFRLASLREVVSRLLAACSSLPAEGRSAQAKAAR